MDARKFITIVGQFDNQAFDPKPYALHFVKALNEIQNEGIEQITDLPLPVEIDTSLSVGGRRDSGGDLRSLVRRVSVAVSRTHLHTMMDDRPHSKKTVDVRRASVFFGQ